GDGPVVVDDHDPRHVPARQHGHPFPHAGRAYPRTARIGRRAAALHQPGRARMEGPVREPSMRPPPWIALGRRRQGCTGQWKSAAPSRVTVTSPADWAANTASSDVSRYGVTPWLNVTSKTSHLPP